MPAVWKPRIKRGGNLGADNWLVAINHEVMPFSVGTALSRFEAKMRRSKELRREATCVEEQLLNVDGLLPE